jgi:hypothetical protein
MFKIGVSWFVSDISVDSLNCSEEKYHISTMQFMYYLKILVSSMLTMLSDNWESCVAEKFSHLLENPSESAGNAPSKN